MSGRRRAYIVLTNGLLVGAFAVGTLLIAVGPPVVAQEQWHRSPAAQHNAPERLPVLGRKQEPPRR